MAWSWSTWGGVTANLLYTATILGLGGFAGYRLKEHLSALSDEQVENVKRHKEGRMRGDHPKKQSKRAKRMGEECTWLNDLLSTMWPSIDAYVVNAFVREWIEPLLQEKIGSSFRFSQATLGNSVPFLGPIKSRRVVDADGFSGVEWTVDVRYDSNVDVAVEYGPVSLEVKDFRVLGTIVINLRPIGYDPAPPFIGGIDFAFRDKPTIDLEFTGGNAIPGLRTTVISAISDALASSIVLPHRIAIPIDQKLSIKQRCKVRCPISEGVIRVKVLRACDLTASDFALFGEGTSDPFVKVTVGRHTAQTEPQIKTLNPAWFRNNEFDFFVASKEQHVLFEVLDHDDLTADDAIGRYSASINELLGQKGAVEKTLSLRPFSGSITVSLQWLDCLGEGEEINADGARSRLSYSGGHSGKAQLHYCGRDVGEDAYYRPHGDCASPFCVGICGPKRGCQCRACYSIDHGKRVAPEEVNSDRHYQEITKDDKEGMVLPDSAVILHARWGSPVHGIWLDVAGKVMSLMKAKSKVNASVEVIGCDPAPGHEKTLRIEYMLPSGPHVGIVAVSIQCLEGFSETSERKPTKIRGTIKSASQRASKDGGEMTRFSSAGFAPWEGYPKDVAKRVEQSIDAAIEAGTYSRSDYEDLGRLSGVTGQRVEELLCPDTGVRRRHNDFMRRYAVAKNQGAEVGALQRILKDADEMRSVWDDAVAAERSARRATADPQFENVLYFLLPEDWEELHLTLIDDKEKPMGGLVFPSQLHGGCIGMRTAHVDADSGEQKVGHYSSVDEEGKVVETHSEIAGTLLEGPFTIPVDRNFLSFTDVKPCRLQGSIHVMNLVPRQQVQNSCCLVVEIIQARQLASLNVTGGSDPYVEVQYAGKARKTECKVGVCNPRWNARFEFPVQSASDVLNLEMKDAESTGYDRFMGRCSINPFSFILGAEENQRRSSEPRKGVAESKMASGKKSMAWPPRAATEWRKLLPRLSNAGDWSLLRQKGRVAGMALGSIEVRISIRGQFPGDLSDRVSIANSKQLARESRADLADNSPIATGAASASSTPLDFKRWNGISKLSGSGAEEPNWEDDGSVTLCPCGVKFGTFSRKHHCRVCGKVFCAACTSDRIDNERSCDPCASVVRRIRSDPLYRLLGKDLSTLYYAELSLWGVTRDDLEDIAAENGSVSLDIYLERAGVESESDREAITQRVLRIFGHDTGDEKQDGGRNGVVQERGKEGQVLRQRRAK